MNDHQLPVDRTTTTMKCIHVPAHHYHDFHIIISICRLWNGWSGDMYVTTIKLTVIVIFPKNSPMFPLSNCRQQKIHLHGFMKWNEKSTFISSHCVHVLYGGDGHGFMDAMQQVLEFLKEILL